MPTDKKSKIHPELLKQYNSPSYRKRIKRMVEITKSLRGIQHGSSIPRGPSSVPKRTATEKEKDAFIAHNRLQVDKTTMHWFAEYNDNRGSH